MARNTGLRELSLCTGALSPLASELAGWTTVAAVENDAFCREVLLRRQLDGVLPVFPIWDDLKTFDGRPWRGAVDLVTAGFPCQPWSTAGKREGESDERNLWPDVLRVVCEVEPEFVFLENVSGLLAARGADGLPYLGRILGELAEGRFNCRWDCIPASSLGAPHQRDRLWVVAHSCGNRVRHESERGQGSAQEAERWNSEPVDDGAERYVADAGNDGLEDDEQTWPETRTIRGSGEVRELGNAEEVADAVCQRSKERHSKSPGAVAEQGAWWLTEPDVGRVVDGCSFRVDRLRTLGGGWVPIVAATAWEIITAEEQW